ncbi:MAG: hypothetical protein HYV35_11060 [Lentisphaerae bacterium]|nr:hypothetical protein [Lentisphaerota bacterium]
MIKRRIFIVPCIAVMLMASVLAIRQCAIRKSISMSNACIGNLRHIEAAKDNYALENGKSNGWAWATDEEAFDELVEERAGSAMKGYPACPASSSVHIIPRSATQSAASYKVNPIGSNPVCKVAPRRHCLP